MGDNQKRKRSFDCMRCGNGKLRIHKPSSKSQSLYALSQRITWDAIVSTIYVKSINCLQHI